MRAALRGIWWRARARIGRLGVRSPAVRPADRLFYALDLDALPRTSADPGLEFRELVPNGDAAATDVGARVESGCVVGLLAGTQVYRVSYVRGDAEQMSGLPPHWRPRGRVVLLHDGYTEAGFRNRGIHSAALRWLLDRERSADVVQAVCVVHADNFVAQRTVTRMGFQCLGRVD